MTKYSFDNLFHMKQWLYASDHIGIVLKAGIFFSVHQGLPSYTELSQYDHVRVADITLFCDIKGIPGEELCKIIYCHSLNISSIKVNTHISGFSF